MTNLLKTLAALFWPAFACRHGFHVLEEMRFPEGFDFKQTQICCGCYAMFTVKKTVDVMTDLERKP
jgi:hypothetical protein